MFRGTFFFLSTLVSLRGADVSGSVCVHFSVFDAFLNTVHKIISVGVCLYALSDIFQSFSNKLCVKNTQFKKKFKKAEMLYVCTRVFACGWLE